MKAIDKGVVCIKTTGKEAGKKVVVLEAIDRNFVMIEGKGVKKRKCNIAHLFPTGEKIGASKKEPAKLE
ncbi:MAG: 50S ribosomal protein L14e [archaeon]